MHIPYLPLSLEFDISIVPLIFMPYFLLTVSKKAFDNSLENLTRKYISGQIKEELYDKLSKEINDKINLLLGEIEELNKKISIKESTKNNKEIIFKYLEKIKKEKDKDKINQFFSLIIDKIIFINSYRYVVYLKI